MAVNTSLTTPYVVLTGVVIVAIAVLFLIIQPTVSHISSVRSQIRQSEQELARQQAFLATLDKKLAELTAQQEHEKRLDVILPENDRMEDALRVFSQSAQSSGVVIATMNNTSQSTQSRSETARSRGELVTTPPSARLLSVDISASGTYQQFRAFIQALEKAPRLMDVRNVTLQSSQTDQSVLGGSMTVVFYSQTVEEGTL